MSKLSPSELRSANLCTRGNRLGDRGERRIINLIVFINSVVINSSVCRVFENNFFSIINILTAIAGVANDQIEGD